MNPAAADQSLTTAWAVSSGPRLWCHWLRVGAGAKQFGNHQVATSEETDGADKGHKNGHPTEHFVARMRSVKAHQCRQLEANTTDQIDNRYPPAYLARFE